MGTPSRVVPLKIPSNARGGDPANGTPTNGELYHYYLYIAGVMVAPSFRESY